MNSKSKINNKNYSNPIGLAILDSIENIPLSASEISNKVDVLDGTDDEAKSRSVGGLIKFSDPSGNPITFEYYASSCELDADITCEYDCAAMLNGEYGVKGMYVGVPVVIGKKGIEKVIEVSLDRTEKTMFKKSVKAVKDLVTACKNIDKSLNSHFKKIKL